MTKNSSTGPKYIPLFDNVLVRPLEPDQTTSSGIVLPDTVKEKSQVGEVIAVGEGITHPDGKKTPMVVKVGQHVLYKKWGGTEVKINGVEWMILEQKEILAIVE